MQILLGFFLAAIVAVLAWRVGALSRSGMVAAIVTGGLIFGLGGLPWATLLLTFFISSSALSRAYKKQKAILAEKFSKGSQRDWGQVLANGGLGAALALAYALSRQPEWLWVAFAGSMAAVNADTWSTELGVLSLIPPRLITSGKRVERGTSGGITLTGSMAALGGAALVGFFAILFTPAPELLTKLLVIILAGFVGALFDSILGATVQAIYWCPKCNKETERHPVHTCGSPTNQLRGLKWFNNDVVNFACSLMGGLVAAGVWLILR